MAGRETTRFQGFRPPLVTLCHTTCRAGSVRASLRLRQRLADLLAAGWPSGGFLWASSGSFPLGLPWGLLALVPVVSFGVVVGGGCLVG